MHVQSAALAVHTHAQSPVTLVITTPTHHVCQVGPPVQLRIRGNVGGTAVGLAVDVCSDPRQLGNEVEGVLKDWLPVLGLWKASLVGLGEHARWLRAEARWWCS